LLSRLRCGLGKDGSLWPLLSGQSKSGSKPCRLSVALSLVSNDKQNDPPAVGSGFLRLSDFHELLDENPRLKEIELSNYGEIFLNLELLPIIAYAYERHVILRADNGVNLNHVRENVLEGLVKYQFRSMTCSSDGASNATYSIYRVRGDCDTVSENIRRINRFKEQYQSEFPRLLWQFVVFGHNEHESPIARKLAGDLGMEFRMSCRGMRNSRPCALKSWSGRKRVSAPLHGRSSSSNNRAWTPCRRSATNCGTRRRSIGMARY